MLAVIDNCPLAADLNRPETFNLVTKCDCCKASAAPDPPLWALWNGNTDELAAKHSWKIWKK